MRKRPITSPAGIRKKEIRRRSQRRKGSGIQKKIRTQTSHTEKQPKAHNIGGTGQFITPATKYR